MAALKLRNSVLTGAQCPYLFLKDLSPTSLTNAVLSISLVSKALRDISYSLHQ
jgi:hypothetical protein